MEVLLAFFGIYTGTSLLGISIRFGWISTRGWRWIHHALFAGIWQAFLQHQVLLFPPQDLPPGPTG